LDTNWIRFYSSEARIGQVTTGLKPKKIAFNTLKNCPFTAATGVRIPYGMPAYNPSIVSKTCSRPSLAGICFFVFGHVLITIF